MPSKQSLMILLMLILSINVFVTAAINLLREIQSNAKHILLLSQNLNDSAKRIESIEAAVGKFWIGNSSSIDVIKFQLRPNENAHVSFSAYKDRTQSSLNSRHIIKFEKTILNIGNHYHPESGIFISPVRGIYMFHWTINNHADLAYTNILVGGKVMSTTSTSYESSHYNTGSAMIIVKVNKGEHVWIQTCCSSGLEIMGNSLGLDNLLQSTFSGTLLYGI